MEHLKKVSYRNVDITDGFWKNRQQINRDVTIRAVEDRFRDTGRFRAFKFDYGTVPDAPKPHYFWDSDIAKWMESAAYIRAKGEDAHLSAVIDELIGDIRTHQDKNGYFNIYHTVVEPEIRFQNQDHHELYCLGHLIEAAVALQEGCADDRLTVLLDAYVDHVKKVFVEDKSSAFPVPGHEEIELALFRLYEMTGNEKYRSLANFFLDERGRYHPSQDRWCFDSYDQQHLPVRRQREALGHCVRACYLYSGMADAARYNDDPAMLEACKALFDDIVGGKMYISGGIGSTNIGEAFTVSYDLPNDTAYAETCASIALAMFANRMKDLEIDSRYADIVELEMYNGILSGVSLDGKSFFYENPLEINLADRTRHSSVRNGGDRLPITQRLEVFGCSCCPPNVTRFLASIGDYAYSYDDKRIFVHQFFGGKAKINGTTLQVETKYPNDGTVRFNVTDGEGKTLYVRIPHWCEKYNISADHEVMGGYAAVRVDRPVFELTVQFEMLPVLIAADPAVRADCAKTAVMYGPILYCAEKVDNAFMLADARIDGAEIKAAYSPIFDASVLKTSVRLTDRSSVRALYFPLKELTTVEAEMTLIPYFGFANRGESDMRVWFKTT